MSYAHHLLKAQKLSLRVELPHRDMGKSHFFDISDFKGRIQCYLNAKAVGEQDFEVFKQLDLGDWIGIEGKRLKLRLVKQL